MALSTILIILFSVLVISSCSNGKSPPKPKAFTFPIMKDDTSNQYYTTIEVGSNSTRVNVVIDLGGKFLFFNSKDYYSAPSSYSPILCDTPQCTIVETYGCILCDRRLPPMHGCTNNTCSDDALNPFTGTQGYNGLGVDVLRVHSTTGDVYKVNRFPFQYSEPVLGEGLSSSTEGLIGLGRSRISLPAQLVSTFNIRHKFSLCLPSISGSRGNMIIGEGPYEEIAGSLFATALIRNRFNTWGNEKIGNFSIEYFIRVDSIRVGPVALSLNKTLLSIDKNTGDGGTSIRTARAYTGLHRSIYQALVKEFVKEAEANNIKRVASVAPFGACFDSNTVASSKTGPRVPTIDLVLQKKKKKNVYWRFYGSNSMVKVSKDVICLAFVDVGINQSGPSTSIVVGGHQMENYLLEFDVASSTLRFSSSLLKLGTSCSKFGAS